MPRYLNFIKGVVDSDDLPLNVNRESIQQAKMLKHMSRKLVRKALDMIKKMADDEDDDDSTDEDTEDSQEEEIRSETNEQDSQDNDNDDDEKDETKTQERKDKYKTFWKEFGKSIKLGIIEDSSNRKKLAKLSRWYSSHNSTELTSFDQYIGRAKEN